MLTRLQLLDTMTGTSADSGNYDGIVFVATAVPEPLTYPLAGAGLVLGISHWRWMGKVLRAQCACHAGACLTDLQKDSKGKTKSIMKVENRMQSVFLGATLLGTLLMASTNAPGQTILQTVTEGAGTDWTAASWGGPPAAVATSGNSYETPSSSFTVRTPNKNLTGLYPTNFAGASLQIDAGGVLYLKNGGTVVDTVIVNLVLNGGAMTFHGGFAPQPRQLWEEHCK